MNTAEPILSLSGATAVTQHHELFKDVEFDVSLGEILAIVGPNGAGKSSLLNAICGDLELTCGLVTFIDRPMQEWDMRQKSCAMALLPQLSLLNFPYTVYEVVQLGRTPHSTGYEVDKEVIREVMALMDITHLSERLYTQLSGGEKQRTQLARVIAQIWREDDAGQRLLLLDEPTSALDLGHQQLLMNAVTAFARSGVAVVMVVHDVNLAASYADHILALKNGEPLAQGTPEKVLTRCHLNELFDAELEVIQDQKTGKRVVLP